MIRTASAALLLAVLGVAGAAEKRAALTVTLRASAAVRGEFVHLDEVAGIDGTGAGAAAKVLLGPAPSAGGRKAFRRDDVACRLEEEGFDRGSFRVVGAGEVVCHPCKEAPRPGPAPKVRAPRKKKTPAGRTPPASSRDSQARNRLARRFAGWVRAALAKRLSCDPERLDVHVGGRVYGELPAGSLEDLTPDVRWPTGRMRLGRQNVVVVLKRGRQRVARLHAYTKTSARMQVLVSTRDLKRDEMIMPGDLRKAEISLTDLGASYLTDGRGLAGACAARSIRAGQPLQAAMFKKQKIVRRGQAVTIVSEVGAVRVTEKAVARSGGGLGDVILVERKGGRPALSVRIAGNGIVKVD